MVLMAEQMKADKFMIHDSVRPHDVYSTDDELDEDEDHIAQNTPEQQPANLVSLISNLVFITNYNKIEVNWNA